MASKNYRHGRARESNELRKILRQKSNIKGARYFGSKGICDVWWITWQGQFCEAQVKSTRIKGKKPYISKAEYSRLKAYAERMKGIIKVYLILGSYRKPAVWRKMN